MDYSSSPLGCARRNPPDVACFRGAQCLVEDKRLQRCAISGGSTTTMHGEVGVNVLQENDDDVDMPNVAIHNTDEEPGVNTESMATVNNVFRNTLADDTEDNNDGISQLLRNVEIECLSERQLRKLEKMRQDDKTSLYRDCPMSKLEADIMLLEFKSTNRLSDKCFDQLLGIIRKILLEK